MTRCANTAYGPRCELDRGHPAPHANGLLKWHDPPLMIVGGVEMPQNEVAAPEPRFEPAKTPYDPETAPIPF